MFSDSLRKKMKPLDSKGKSNWSYSAHMGNGGWHEE